MENLLGWQAGGGAGFEFVLIFFLPGFPGRPHPWPLLLVALHTVPLPLLLPAHSLLLSLPLSLPLPFPLPAFPLAVVSLALTVPVALSWVSLSFSLL